MTVGMLDKLEHIEAFEGAPDDEEHLICIFCFPGYEPGKIVWAICGAPQLDAEPGTWEEDLPNACNFCDTARFCPTCGEEL